MGGYLAYTEYKDSGIEWLGKIPSHWNYVKLRFLLLENFANGLFKKKDEWGSGTRIINVFDAYTENDLINEESLDRVECSESEAERYSAKHGDFFFVRSSLKLEGIGKSATLLNPEEPMVFECHLVRGRLNLAVGCPEFLNYYLNSDLARQNLVSKANQVTMTTIDQSKFKDLPISLPKVIEQRSIARFLDYKTAQIDALIAKKETLLKKLAEKRTALISQAVTKGCDRGVPMKDSAIEWLGEIPEHWEIKRLKFVVDKIIDTPHKTAPYDDSREFLVARTTNVRNGRLLLDGAKFTDEATYREWISRAVPEPGDILFTREAPAGEACLVPATPKLCLGQRMVLFKFDSEKYDGYFLLHSIYSGIADEFVKSLSLGSTVSHFNMSDIGSIPLIIPPFEEQKRISFWLSYQINFYDNQIEKVELGIRHLREYRTALITNAVTGKIDVRDVKLPELESVEVA